ncbi:flagellar basal body P-ring formation chaperone FlgA [Pseudorhodoplanes sp.]|uniref:flagellar basal body P-ring formation chaperone FlgA n=1 Tax=Pseudorhodoplanes sp. TaxID=1934341 RepID=UPI002C66BA5D|nr:flagellar basal body P-ring formation chaperone FlgA [Pseudorhodoplanes sp.]HWV51568.1 flagellar basal body P-ring formation chaperone FlgA [Pseudorhodoplanes sp.]
MMTRLAALALIALASSANAQTPSLRPTVLVSGDLVRIGDLVADVETEKADIAVFRAPDLGETGSVRVAAVIEALRPHNIDIDPNGLSQVSVTRASRMIGANEIKRRIAEIVAERLRIGDAANIAVMLDMPAPTLHLDPNETGPLMPSRMQFDPRGGRFDLTFQSGEAHVRLTGSANEAYDAVVLARPIARGDVLRASDVKLEKRPKTELQNDTVRDLSAAVGMAAQQPLRAGQAIRTTDLARPVLVKRSESVMIVYEVPGIVLTARGKAEESGSMGDTVNVLNVQSKRTVQGVVTGPNQITVTSLTPRVISSAALTKAQ